LCDGDSGAEQDCKSETERSSHSTPQMILFL
jgi:hypothetical protein